MYKAVKKFAVIRTLFAIGGERVLSGLFASENEANISAEYLSNDNPTYTNYGVSYPYYYEVVPVWTAVSY